MKKNLLLFLFFFSFYVGKAQWVSIPDTNFGTWLDSNLIGCMQGNNQIGWQMDTTCPLVASSTIAGMFCSNAGIRDLTGIQYFDSVQFIDCSHNLLASLPSLPKLLWGIDISYNQFTSLPVLPIDLTDLYCTNNQFTSLPQLPTSLETLACNSNQLNSLPVLPSGLIHLHCDYNQLSSLPTLPVTLALLWCSSNLIDSLPVLPSGLTNLDCSNNSLSVLPNLPSGLTWLHCHGNNITNLPELPDSLFSFFIGYNPITCFPRLKRIVNLDFQGANITCLPDYGEVSNSNPPLISVPLCDLFNPNGCGVYWNISGKVYLDANGNCVQNGSESGILNIPVQLYRNGSLLQQVLSPADGIYSFDTDSLGTYIIAADTSGLPFFINCPADGVDTAMVTALDSFHYNKDIAFGCKPGFDLAAWSIEGRFRPGNTRQVNIHVGSSSNFYGINCAGGISGSVTISITGPATYVSPAPGALIPDNVSGNVLTYNVADFGTVNFNSNFNIMVQTDTTAQIGDTICFTVTVSPVTGDDFPTNNIQTHCFPVVAAFDPNDKQVYPLSDVDVNGERWLTYTVNFQNTGTDTAIHIYITDTLDTDLDVSTFQLLAYSHQPLVQLKENAVRFNFPNIMLVDSHANEPLSHGYVQYKIKIKDGKPVGTVISNTAYIYFDFNVPVVTNTTTNVLAIVNDVEEFRISDFGFRIYPNPANTSVTIAIDGLADATIVITDITGREMLRSVFTISTPQFDIRNFESGVYFVTVIGKEGRSATKKLAIE